ncbi:antennal-enriched udp-glycosyltransferase [Stylonychia lemnae]|uniref:Antennal-enriched udp-glycosyltransferase n=1 Tax=Stylonychia lemnae TaxID=5949 RepID=A0A078AJH3_STYLE|nr:antennal-enriched udp-glycosyltransferase [Stylonychia lemnae]|eukprot:CDW82500.1 antennal-enriched udp-glycosyltransferase [Stylonychia lemnae]
MNSKQQKQNSRAKKIQVLYVGFQDASHPFLNVKYAIELQQTQRYNVTFMIHEDSKHIPILKENKINLLKLSTTFKYPKSFNNRTFPLHMDFAKFIDPQFYILISYQFESWRMFHHGEFSNSLWHNSIVLRDFLDINEPSYYNSFAGEIYRRFVNLWSIFNKNGYDQRQLVPSINQLIENPSHLFEKPPIKQLRSPDLVLIPGIIGGSIDQMPYSPRIKIIHQKFQQDVSHIQISKEMQTFINQFQHIILVSKGSENDPSTLELYNLNYLAKIRRNYGFIVKISDQSKIGNNTLNEIRSRKNVIIEQIVNQPLLLKHPKTKIFYGAGGISSILECIQHNKIFIIKPLLISFDQQMNCQFIQRNGVGQCLWQDDKQSLINAIVIAEQQNFTNPRLKQLQQQYQMQATDEEDFLYWTDFVTTVGFTHLKQKSIARMTDFNRMGIDIRISISIMIMLLMFILIKIWKRMLNN